MLVSQNGHENMVYQFPIPQTLVQTINVGIDAQKKSGDSQKVEDRQSIEAKRSCQCIKELDAWGQHPPRPFGLSLVIGNVSDVFSSKSTEAPS